MASPDQARKMRQMQGEIWRTNGLAIEQLLIGRSVPGTDDDTIWEPLGGGILLCDLFHPKETGSIPTPDFFSRDPELVGDVVHFEIDGPATPTVQEVRDMLSDGIDHTLYKLTDETLRHLCLNDPRIMPMIAFGPEFHPGDLDAMVPIIDGIMTDPGFGPKNRIDALVVYFYPEPLDPQVPRFVLYTHDTGFTNRLFRHEHRTRTFQ